MTNEERMIDEERYIPLARRFVLDGAPIDIDDFIEENGFAMEDIEQIGSLEVGEEVVYGGGAAATFVLRRVA